LDLSTKQEGLITQIEKNRYLIPCKCTICNKSFEDLILGSRHVSEKHQNREVKNVIENLTWDVKSDLKNWEILQSLKIKRDTIISRLTNENAIKQATIPETIEIARKKVNITSLIENLQVDLSQIEAKLTKKEEAEDAEEIEEELSEKDFSDSEEGREEEVYEIEEEEEVSSKDQKKEIEEDLINELEDEGEEINESETQESQSSGETEIITETEDIENLAQLLDHEVEKYVRSIRRIPMAIEVKRYLESKKGKTPMLYKLEDQLDYYLGVTKAALILRASK
jgi:predicted XRE-type DNA-binding protein